jgi:hypothetical protein
MEADRNRLLGAPIKVGFVATRVTILAQEILGFAISAPTPSRYGCKLSRLIGRGPNADRHGKHLFRSRIAGSMHDAYSHSLPTVGQAERDERRVDTFEHLGAALDMA